MAPAFGESLSDATGLAERFDVQTEGHIFEIKTVSNFDVTDHEFDKDEKRLTIFFSSSLENNLGEIIIPQNLLGGNFTFYLNDQEFFPKIQSNEKISFITLNFTGSGNNKVDIFGTTYLDGITERDEIDQNIQTAIRKGETFDDSFGWVVLVGSLAVVAAYVVMKIKKRK